MTGKRAVVGRGKGYLSAAGAQYRFIVFLILVLGLYTLLLKVFQKLAEIVQLSVFLPIALISLLFFIGIVGTLYSHSFTGPLARIRKTIEHLAEGDTNVSLRLRESDDPSLKDLVSAITLLCEHSRNSHALIRDTARDLMADITALKESIQHGSDKAHLQKHLDGILKKQDLLEKAVRTHGQA
jgi:methyl-accepting chemotaxis protein